MNDVGTKAEKASNLRRTQDLQLNEATDVLRGAPDKASAQTLEQELEQALPESGESRVAAVDPTKSGRAPKRS